MLSPTPRAPRGDSYPFRNLFSKRLSPKTDPVDRSVETDAELPSAERLLHPHISTRNSRARWSTSLPFVTCAQAPTASRWWSVPPATEVEVEVQRISSRGFVGSAALTKTCTRGGAGWAYITHRERNIVNASRATGAAGNFDDIITSRELAVLSEVRESEFMLKKYQDWLLQQQEAEVQQEAAAAPAHPEAQVAQNHPGDDAVIEQLDNLVIE